jgi:hypothetical protein
VKAIDTLQLDNILERRTQRTSKFQHLDSLSGDGDGDDDDGAARPIGIDDDGAGRPIGISSMSLTRYEVSDQWSSHS